MKIKISPLSVLACVALTLTAFAGTGHQFTGTWITDAEMVALEPKPISARQLESGKLPPPDKNVRNRHILFRRAFELGHVGRAVVYLTADDYYKLYVNGRFVGQGPASGEPNHFPYNEIDVTEYLKPGRNVLAVHTFYQGLVNRVWTSGDNRHGLLLDLVVDGRTMVSSDAMFLTARHGAYQEMGVVGYDTQFMERYDAGAREVGFERLDFDDASWKHAVVHPRAGDYATYPQLTDPVVTEEIQPASIEEISPGRLRLDFGGVYVGAMVFSATGRRGDVVGIRCGQELNPDGSVRYKMRSNCDYYEEMILSGSVCDRLEPYDYKSFRYAEIDFPKGVRIDLGSILLRARHMPFALRARRNFTDPELEPIWKLCVESFRWGVQEQVMDCMEREKGYYLGDGCYTTYTWCLLTGDWRMARRFVDDFLRTASIDRGLVTCGCCSFMQEIAEYPLMLFWLAREYVRATGDISFISDRYQAFADVLDAYRERYAREDGLIRNLDKWCVVEWPKNFHDGYDADVSQGKVCTDMHNVVNAWYIAAIGWLNEIAELSGRPVYRDEQPLKEAFVRVFYDQDRHLFVDREGSTHISLPGNVYAQFAGLAPKSDSRENRRAFLSLVREKAYSSISLFQFFPLFSWLRTNGEESLLQELLRSPDAWNRNLREGATRTFEGWGKDTKWNTSLFHLTIASAAAFMCEGPMDVPSRREYDVCVVGGGAAGVAAALQSARAGARTLLVERGFQVGGNMTTGGVNFPGLFHAWGRQVIDGCGWELVTNAVLSAGCSLPDFAMDPGQSHWLHQVRFDIPLWVALAEEALEKAEVEVRYHTAPSSATWVGGRWWLRLAADGRLYSVTVRCLVDATGDGTLAVMAGGRRLENAASRQPGTFNYFLDPHVAPGGFDQTELECAKEEAVRQGRLLPTDMRFSVGAWLDDAGRVPPGGGLSRAGRVANYVPDADLSTPARRTETDMRARASMLRVYRFLRSLPGLEKTRIASAAAEVGIRETYRVEGDYVMTGSDYLEARAFDDGLCHAFYPVDLHDEKNGGVVPHHLRRGLVPSVPLRALIAKGVNNVLVAGRCISSDREANSALRVEATCMATGQVAGEAAAFAAERDCSVRELPLDELKNRLRRRGCVVPEAHR